MRDPQKAIALVLGLGGIAWYTCVAIRIGRKDRIKETIWFGFLTAGCSAGLWAVYLSLRTFFDPPPNLDPIADTLAMWAGLGGACSAVYTFVKAHEELTLLRAGTPEEAAAEKLAGPAPVPVAKAEDSAPTPKA